MKEDFLQYIWANSLYRSGDVRTQGGKQIRILDVGRQNRDAGPDFFNARISVGDVVMAGNVEVHINSSDWYRHKHHLDRNYDNVILSVVRRDDAKVYTSEGREVDSLVMEYADYLYYEYLFMRDTLRKPGCHRHLDRLDDAWFYMTLQSLAIERLERKVNDLREIYGEVKGDWEECFYRQLCRYWVTNVNAEACCQLSCHVPYRTLQHYVGRPFSAEALLLGAAGLLDGVPEEGYGGELLREWVYLQKKHAITPMEPGQWRYMRTRPSSFPTVRVALLAAMASRTGTLLTNLLKTEKLKEVFRLFDVQASTFWDTHYQFFRESHKQRKSLGWGSQQILIINAVIPFLFFYGRQRGEERIVERAMRWLEEMKPENNFIVRSWSRFGFEFDSAMHTQALVQLRREYCDNHRCMECRVGREVFARLGERRQGCG